MKKTFFPLILLGVICLSTAGPAFVAAKDGSYDPAPPFSLKLLNSAEGGAKAYGPRNPYNIFINYELGMHCVGFDLSYCCIIPPYNSVQAQAVKAGTGTEPPRLLSPGDEIRLYYFIRDNSYSEGNKMKYWQIAKDVDMNGRMGDPGDSLANYVWDHLFIYKDLSGTLPAKWKEEERLRVGRDLPINVDSGPTNKILAGGYMDYATEKGGNIVFTDSLIPEVKNVSLKLTSSYLWDALGLPLTAFYDSRRKGTIRTISNKDYQPYQYATVQLRTGEGKPFTSGGKPMEFFGTNPIDIPNCYACHSGQGIAADRSRKEGLSAFEKEYRYWMKNYPDVTDYVARLQSASVNILELHDRHHGTGFLKDYGAGEPSNRLGKTGSVYCADCHGDNISGNLQTPRSGATGYKGVKSKTLSEAVHAVHMRFVPMPDKAGRTQNCQACHPSHWQEEAMNDFDHNSYEMIDEQGKPRFSNADLRTAGGGCFLRRDAHSNPDVKPPFFLNEIGRWYLNEVSLKDENGKPVSTMRGLYCTHCHNQLAHELYNYDELSDTTLQTGKTLRNKSISEIVSAIAKGDAVKFRTFFADPVAGAAGDPLYAYYADHASPTLVRAGKDEKGGLKLLPWNAGKGDPVPYSAASGGSDWWLAPGEPHCANCHSAPFVESEGGQYFPIDQPNKYSLYRYSKAHGVIACQSCHQSMHGLYPVRYEGMDKTVDLTSHQQALQFSPDGKYAGPVTCAACHAVNDRGVPAELNGTAYEKDYWASVVLVHFIRESDRQMPVSGLLKKYPYQKAREIAARGWK